MNIYYKAKHMNISGWITFILNVKAPEKDALLPQPFQYSVF